MKKEIGLSCLISIILLLGISLVMGANTLPKPPESPTNYNSGNNGSLINGSVVSSGSGFNQDSSAEASSDDSSSEVIPEFLKKVPLESIKFYLLGLIVIVIIVAVILVLKNANKSKSNLSDSKRK